MPNLTSNDPLVGQQGLAAPVLGDEGEPPMLDPVPPDAVIRAQALSEVLSVFANCFQKPTSDGWKPYVLVGRGSCEGGRGGQVYHLKGFAVREVVIRGEGAGRL